ncbi:HEAT repeat domain-containing protein [bacterium]|nr:HEAT repeat domain-containing protein [bacterium]
MKEIESKLNDPILRAHIASLLSNTDKNSYHDLQNYLKDSDPRVIACAIESLMKIGSTSALANLVQYVAHSNPRLKSTAIKALHNLGDESAFHLFEKMAKSDYSSYRDSVVFALAEISHPRAVFLLEQLLHDSVESIRLKALKGLEKLKAEGNQKAREVLSSKLQFKENLTKNYDIGDQLNETPAALHSDDIAVRMNALIKISNSNHCKAIHQIIERLKIEQEIKVISCALIALARVKGPDNLKVRFFMHYLSHEDHRVRANSIECLSTIITDDKKDFFLAYLNDENNRVIGNAIVALCQSTHYEEEFSYFVIKAIFDLFDSEDENYVLTAIYCTGVVQSKQLLPALMKAFRSNNQKLKEKALEILTEWSKNSQEVKPYLDEIRKFNKKKDPLAKHKLNKNTVKPNVQKDLSTKKISVINESQKEGNHQESSTISEIFRIASGKMMLITQIFIVLASCFSFYRWGNILLSNEGNLYVRAFSLLGFLLCGIWIVIGILFPLFAQKGIKYIYTLMSVDLFFTLIVGLIILRYGDLLSGCVFMFHGFGFLVVLGAFIFQLQKNRSFL